MAIDSWPSEDIDEFIDVMKKKLILGWIRDHQDLVPCHISKLVTKLFKDNHIKVLVWPGNPSDLNPI